MSYVGPPSAEEQLEFLKKLQRLLGEGNFTASYKFALLHAIADLCVQMGDDSGAELELHTFEIAEQFIRLYWCQTAPYVTSDHQQILKQNTGRQAAIINCIAKQYKHHHGSLASLERSGSEWTDLIRQVERTVSRMPLWKLQTLGAERLEFLYQNLDRGNIVRLKPGVAYCFRVFYSMVREMIKGAWSMFVQKQNLSILGQVTDLSSFLFGSQRSSLSKYYPLLREVQSGRCFYCDKNVTKTKGDIDHFIPWRLYALDLGHNFVLAHKGCNSSKSDLLAAEEHLERWMHRSQVYKHELEDGFDQLNVLHSWPTTHSIARWAYHQSHQAGRQVWVEKKIIRPLSGAWNGILEEI